MTKWLSSFAYLCGIALFATSCVSDNCETVQTYQVMEPVYMQGDDFRTLIQPETPRDLCSNGQIYYYLDFLIVAAPKEGLHIIDNANPASPQSVAFLPIPGVENVAIRNDRLYANSYVDLVVFDFSNPAAPTFVSRSEDVFAGYNYIDPERGYLVDYLPRERVQVTDCGAVPLIEDCPDCIFIDEVNGGIWGIRNFSLQAESAAFDAANGSTSQGVGGSLARFTIAQSHMYVVSDYDMLVFDLRNGNAPELVNTVNLGWGIETIFPYQDKLFIGSTTGMHIYDAADPAHPQQLSVFRHANACDPVFVDGHIAYVTLRDGTECQDFTNQLDVVDVTDLTNPVLLRTYPMHHPIGISVADNHLYLCDDDEGLKVFDVTNWQTIDQNLVSHLRTMTTRDVITLPGKQQAIVIGDDGLLQLDITNPAQLQQLSLIPACN